MALGCEVSELQRHVRSFCDFNADDEDKEAEAKRALNYVLVEVQRGRLELKNLVKALGSSLTHSEPGLRRRGLLLLAEVLTRLPKLALNRSSLDTLLSFLSSRADDYPCSAEVLKGLVALARHHQLPQSQAALVCQRIFQEITIQSLPQPARKDAYDIFWLLLQNPATAKELEAMSEGGFAVGLVAAIDGEKDPRNLLTCFQLTSWVLARFAPAALSQDLYSELFDVTSCYFPITFTPPPKDPFGITTEQLKDGLQQVFTSSSELAPFALPFLLDKMESLDEMIKIDALESLRGCLLSYDRDALSPFLAELWVSLRKALSYAGAPEAAVGKAVLDCVKALAGMLAPDQLAGFQTVHATSPDWSTLEQLLLKDMAEESRVLDSKACRSMAALLVATSSASLNAHEKLLAKTKPFLEKLYYSKLQPSQREALLTLLVELLEAGAGLLLVAAHLPGPRARPPLQALGWAPMLLEVFSTSILLDASAAPTPRTEVTTERAEAIVKEQIRATALRGLGRLVTFGTDLPRGSVAPASSSSSSSSALSSCFSVSNDRLLSPAEVTTVTQELTRLLFADPAAAVRSECLQTLLQLSRHRMAPLLNITVPVLKDYLAAVGPLSQAREESRISENSPYQSLESTLEAIAVLSDWPEVLRALLPALLTVVSRNLRSGLLTSPTQEAAHGKDALAPEVISILDCISRVTEQAAGLDETHFQSAERQQCLDALAVPMANAFLSILIPAVVAAGQPRRLQSKNGKKRKPRTERSEKNSFSDSVASWELDSRVIKCVAKIMRTLSRTAAPTTQHNLVKLFNRVFLDGDISALVPAFKLSSAFTPFPDFKAETTNGMQFTHMQLLPVYSSVLSTFHPSAELEFPRAQNIMQKLQHCLMAFDASSAASIAETLAMSLAAVVNKLPPVQLRQLLPGLVDEGLLKVVRCGSGVSVVQRCCCLRAYAWTAKALVMCGERDGYVAAQVLADLLNVAEAGEASRSSQEEKAARELGLVAAEAYRIILADSDVVLNKFCHAVSRPLYKQRFFHAALRILLQLRRASSSSSPSRGRVLLAIAHLLPPLPKTVLLENRATLLPSLLEAVCFPWQETNMAELVQQALATLKLLLSEDVRLAAPHAHSLIPRLVVIAQNFPRPMARLHAVGCLDAFAALPYHRLHPHRDMVLKGLQYVLDDRRRAVRKQAARCRNIWFTIE